MSPSIPVTEATSLAAGTAARRGNASTAWALWLPLACAWLALFLIEHKFANASIEYAQQGDAKIAAIEAEGSNAARQIGVIALGAMGVMLLAIPSAAESHVNKALLFAVFSVCGLLFFSAAWASDPMLSIKRSAQPILLMVAALGIAKHLRPRDLCRFAAYFAGTVLAVGFVAAVLQGSFLYGDAYRFSGTLHPNAQAVNCAVLCLASLAMLCERDVAGQLQWRWALPFVAGLFFMLLTRSRTTTMAFMAGLLAFAWLGATWPRRFVIGSALALGAACCLVLFLASDARDGGALMGAVQMGRGDEDIGSLTGRIPIWQAVAVDIAKRPLLGFGFGSFWDAQRVWEYSFIRHWQFNHAHSVYFETLLNVGFIGLALGLFIIVWTGWTAGSRYTTTHDAGYRFIAALVVAALVHGLVDSNFAIFGFAPLVIMLCISMLAMHGEMEREPMAAVERPAIRTHFRTLWNY